METLALDRKASTMSLNFTNALSLRKKESDALSTAIRPSINLDFEDDNTKQNSNFFFLEIDSLFLKVLMQRIEAKVKALFLARLLLISQIQLNQKS